MVVQEREEEGRGFIQHLRVCRAPMIQMGKGGYGIGTASSDLDLYAILSEGIALHGEISRLLFTDKLVEK